MSDNRKYYYLKLKDDFFDTDAMILLENMQDGHLYSNILLKLYLRSLKGEGKLMFNNTIPYNSSALAQVTRHNVGTVEKALEIFEQLELIEVLDNGAIYMSDIQTFIGTSSTEADRKREYRQRINEEKGNDQKQLGQMSGQSSDKNPPEIEIELELEKDIEKEQIPYVEIINYLNDAAGKNYRSTTRKTKDLIKARWNEGFTVDDFKKVINTKNIEWKNDEKMSKFIRPDTLFGTKFEGYLNQEQKGGGSSIDWDDL